MLLSEFAALKVQQAVGRLWSAIICIRLLLLSVFLLLLNFLTLAVVISCTIFEYNNNNLLHEFTPCQRTQRWSLSLEFALYAALWSELNQCWQFADLPIRLDEMIISFWRIVINIMTPAAAPSDTDYDLVT